MLEGNTKKGGYLPLEGHPILKMLNCKLQTSGQQFQTEQQGVIFCGNIVTQTHFTVGLNKSILCCVQNILHLSILGVLLANQAHTMLLKLQIYQLSLSWVDEVIIHIRITL